MLRLLPVILVLSLLGGCSAAGVVPGQVTVRGPTTPWDCSPINPLDQNLPDDPCFRAVLTAENEITLQWRVVNTLPQVYIYDDFGVNNDIGFQSADCPTVQKGTCSTSLKVNTGGFRRWVIRAEHPGGTRTHVAASITVPSPPPPLEVYGGGFVDMLSPTDRTVSWIVDKSAIPCEEVKQNAWIEREGSIFFAHKQRFPRCGRGARFTIPAAKLMEPGFQDFKFRDCHLVAGTEEEFCSPYVSVGFNTSSDYFLGPNPLYTESGQNLAIRFTDKSGDVRRLSSPTLIDGDNGQAFVETSEPRYTIDASLLTPGKHSIELMSCISHTGTCSGQTSLLVLVDSTVNWNLGREYTEDFLPGVAHEVLGPGEPLDIAYDASGGIWLINEFSNAIEHVSPAGLASSLTVPLARNPKGTRSVHATVKPFATDVGVGKLLPVYTSTLGERVALVDKKIWVTQGGGMLGPVDIPNHARVISYDPSLSDSPATPYDDRLCVYNVPTDDPDRFGNNQVIGLSATNDRIWIGESRGLFDHVPSAISSFIPNPDSCGNLLNFADPEELANQDLQYCGPGRTPEQDGCMQKFLLDKLPRGLKVAHLATDPVDDSLWFTDARGMYLGHLDPQRDRALMIHLLPDSHRGHDLFKGFPWSLRVDESAVYVGEYSAADILRFDKAKGTFDELHVPVASPLITLHSIEIDASTERLWFTLSNDTSVPDEGSASTIGYIDLVSWREHIANPERTKTGVIYKGLDAIPPSKGSPFVPPSYRGIAVDPASGKIALATNARNQVTELTPKDGFWQ